MKIFYLTATLILLSANIVQAQMLFQDSKGESSFDFQPGGIIGINTSKESLKIRYLNRSSKQQFFYGIDVEGKPTEGISTLFSASDNKVNLTGQIELILGFDELITKDKGDYDFLSASIEYSGAKFKRVTEDTTFANQVIEESYSGISLGLDYNYIYKGKLFFGTGVKVGGTNNFSDLKKRTVKNITTNIDPISGVERQIIEEINTVRGKYVEEFQALLLFDFAYLPKFFGDRIFINSYLRYAINSETNNFANLGFGLFVNQKDNRNAVIGGLYYEIKDIFNQKEDEPDFLDRGKIGFSLGYNF